MSRKDFIASFTGNESSSVWLDNQINGGHTYSGALKGREKEIRKVQQILFDFEAYMHVYINIYIYIYIQNQRINCSAAADEGCCLAVASSKTSP